MVRGLISNYSLCADTISTAHAAEGLHAAGREARAELGHTGAYIGLSHTTPINQFMVQFMGFSSWACARIYLRHHVLHATETS